MSRSHFGYEIQRETLTPYSAYVNLRSNIKIDMRRGVQVSFWEASPTRDQAPYSQSVDLRSNIKIDMRRGVQVSFWETSPTRDTGTVQSVCVLFFYSFGFWLFVHPACVLNEMKVGIFSIWAGRGALFVR